MPQQVHLLLEKLYEPHILMQVVFW